MHQDWWDDKRYQRRLQAKRDADALNKRIKEAKKKQEEGFYGFCICPDGFEADEPKTSTVAIRCANVLLDSWELFAGGEIGGLLCEARELQVAEAGEDYEF